ncbi:MAG TPA: xanthine dehydrogenase family protein subunit M [Armatimonadota bacterium]|nr:xanthine dehydrogenase family protein subunit M [Armatimonadota bacterium]
MKSFRYAHPDSMDAAVHLLNVGGDRARPIAGGIDLLDEMKEYIISPETVVNLKTIPGLNRLEVRRDGLTIGPLVTLAEIAADQRLQDRYAALSGAALSVGTPQIQHVGTVGGNLCQRPRCWYYRDEDIICLKKGGDRCYAVAGDNRYHAIFGGGPSYIVHPSDMAPALMAHGASVTIAGPKGRRTVPLDEFFVLPAQNVLRENILTSGEIVASIHVPAPPPGARSVYIKQRGRESFDWALASAAVLLHLERGQVSHAAVVMGGVAPKPWRAVAAEKALVGKHWSPDLAAAAAAAAVKDAEPMPDNGYKVPLARETVRLALLEAAGETNVQ